jgi:two-component system chemotaxis response regulator CheB
MNEADARAARRVIVAGASAGGVEALSAVARRLPADLPAAVVVVLHLPPDAKSRLSEILDRAGPLPAAQAQDGAQLLESRIVVAPPDRHVVLADGRTWLVNGARENGVRPAADPLFRSAARAFDRNAIGLVLSGTLDDGTAGLAAIAAAGGTTIAQDPHDAVAPGMPRAAIERAPIDHIAPAEDIGPLLARLVTEPPPRRERAAVLEQDLGPSDIACPACGGVLRRVTEAGIDRFRCRVGHAYSPESLVAAQDESLEAALWTALRALEEQAAVAERLAEDMRQRQLTRAADRFDDRHQEAIARAAVIRDALDRSGDSLPVDDLGSRPSENGGGAPAPARSSRRPD